MVLAADLANRDFYASVGRTLVRWRVVETSLFALLRRLLKTTEHQAVVTVWHSHTGLNGRLGLITGLINELWVGTTHPTEWRTVRKMIEKERDVRNQLAHSDVVFSATIFGADDEALPPGFQLTDPAPRRVHRPAAALTLTQIDAAGVRFEELAKRIDNVL